MFGTVYAIAALVFRLVVVGDVGDGSAAVARGIASLHNVDAIVLTGDNVYPCGVQSASDAGWSVVQPLMELGLPIYPVLGNHDHCGNADAEIDTHRPYWIFPAKEYTFETPYAEFRMIDTTPYVQGAKPPPLFLFVNRGWRIVVGHHPLLSSGYHGRFSRSEHRRMLDLLPALRAAKVDLYISGHDHHLELIDGHPLMLISGAGSEPVPPVFRHARTRFATEGRVKGFAILDLTAASMTIQFYDSAGNPISGRFVYRRP